MRLRLQHGEEKKDHPVMDKEIIVNVNPAYSVKTFILQHWKWFASAIILPIIGLAWKYIAS